MDEGPWPTFSHHLDWIRGISYTTSTLISIGATIVSRPRLPQQVFKRLQYLGISKIRQRLSRGGKQTRARHIPTVNYDNFRKIHETRGVNFTNLTAIPLTEETSPKQITLGSMNARSVKNKEDDINELIVDNEIDILGICETWLRSGETDNIIKKNHNTERIPSGRESTNRKKRRRSGYIM